MSSDTGTFLRWRPWKKNNKNKVVISACKYVGRLIRMYVERHEKCSRRCSRYTFFFERG